MAKKPSAKTAKRTARPKTVKAKAKPKPKAKAKAKAKAAPKPKAKAKTAAKTTRKRTAAAAPKQSPAKAKTKSKAAAKKPAKTASPARQSKKSTPAAKAAPKKQSKGAATTPKPKQKLSAKPTTPATVKAPKPAAGKETAAVRAEMNYEKFRDLSPNKPASKEFLVGIASAIKDAVAPIARTLRGREVVGEAVSGDATFELDAVGERTLLNYLKNVRAPVAYYSEDSGYSTFTGAPPRHLLVVDPVDGSRAAKNGFEGCAISVASTRVIERPTLGDIDAAIVMDLMADRYFIAERGKGARMYVDGQPKRIKLSENEDLESLCWSMTVPARPAELIFPTAARLIDLSSLKGGFFACNSTAYSLTRLVSNQLDASADFASRYMHDIPDLVHDYFINAGRGAVLGIAPYDMAAALLIAKEAGCIVTDAYGKGFDEVLALDSSAQNHQTIIAAANANLHKKLLSFFDTRIKQFENLLKRKAAAAG